MHSLQVDFDVFKAITARRPHEGISENDVLREMLGLPALSDGKTRGSGRRGPSKSEGWKSEGVTFMIGMQLQHRFRGGRVVTARIVQNGVEYDGTVYGGLSPAAAAASGHQANGWQFWEVYTLFGWRKADTLRH
jgi:hypothetical protein